MANFREQLIDNTEVLTPCASCDPSFRQISVCFGTTQDFLCCQNGSPRIIFVPFVANQTDAQAFDQALVFFNDSSLETRSQRGFYSINQPLCGSTGDNLPQQ